MCGIWHINRSVDAIIPRPNVPKIAANALAVATPFNTNINDVTAHCVTIGYVAVNSAKGIVSADPKNCIIATIDNVIKDNDTIDQDLVLTTKLLF